MSSLYLELRETFEDFSESLNVRSLQSHTELQGEFDRTQKYIQQIKLNLTPASPSHPSSDTDDTAKNPIIIQQIRPPTIPFPPMVETLWSGPHLLRTSAQDYLNTI